MSESQGEPTPRTLYANEDQSRFFWIPPGLEFPPGRDTLRSLSGVRLDTTVEAVSSYEIPQEEAKEIVRVQLQSFMSTASTALGSLGELVQRFQEASEKAAELDLEGRKKEREQRVAKALGLEASEATDPSKVMKGLQGLLSGLTEKLRNTDDLRNAKARRDVSEDMQKLGDVAVHQASQEAEDTLATLRQGLADVFTEPETRENLAEATGRLKEMAAQLRELRAEASAAHPQAADNQPRPGEPDDA